MITDRGITSAAYLAFARGPWREVEQGATYFGTDILTDLMVRAKELRDGLVPE